MNILRNIEFFDKIGGMCSTRFILDVIKIYNIGFFTLNINIDREDIEEICMLEIEDEDDSWSLDDITIIYDIYDNTQHDSMAKCAIIHEKTSKLIKLFTRTKKLKAFL